MADEIVEDPQLEALENPAEETPPAAPSGADRLAELEAKLENLSSTHAQLQQNYNTLLANQLAGNRPAVAVEKEPDLEDVSDEEFQAAVEEGNGRKVAQLAKRQAKIEATRMARTLKADSIDPLQNMLGVGFEAVSAQAMEIARPQLKFLKRFEKEITETLRGLGPQQKISADAIKHAHNLFVGANFDTLVDEEIERRQRAKVANPGGGPTPRRGVVESREPQPEDLGGQDGAVELARHGGGDRFAFNLGYRGPDGGQEGAWNAYMKGTAKYRGAA